MTIGRYSISEALQAEHLFVNGNTKYGKDLSEKDCEILFANKMPGITMEGVVSFPAPAVLDTYVLEKSRKNQVNH